MISLTNFAGLLFCNVDTPFKVILQTSEQSFELSFSFHCKFLQRTFVKSGCKIEASFHFQSKQSLRRTYHSLVCVNFSKIAVYFCTTYYEISQFVFSIYYSNDIFEVCFIASLPFLRFAHPLS